jgi:hypothetical protein
VVVVGRDHVIAEPGVTPLPHQHGVAEEREILCRLPPALGHELEPLLHVGESECGVEPGGSREVHGEGAGSGDLTDK